MVMDGKITLTDINVAAYLEMNGQDSSLVRQDSGRVVFTFPDEEKVRDLIDRFNYEQELSYFTFCLKRLRGRMLELRDGSRRNGSGNHYADRARQ